MKLAIIGTGYVGLVTGTCLSELGNDVLCVDKDKDKIEMLKKGDSPIYEPGLQELIKKNIYEGRLSFVLDMAEAVRFSDITFLCVGTPQGDDGSADLSCLFKAAEKVALSLEESSIVVTKSTVPVGTNHKIKDLLKRISGYDIEIASIPEFLKEGTAVKDFMNPDRIIIGTESKSTKEILHELMKPLERIHQPILHTDIKSAEMIKYTANSFLATKISFINEIANLCEDVGADIDEVYKGIALDNRIGHRFLQSGIGYGGSCFPKDVRALMRTAESFDCSLDIIKAADEVNTRQRYVVIEKLQKHLGVLEGKNIGILGLAFKPKTDDIRESPALSIIRRLLEDGAKIRAFDPVANENARKSLGDEIYYATDSYDALVGCDAVIIATQWDEFKGMSKKRMRELMSNPLVIDGRNIYTRDEFEKEGFTYEGIGK
ncbi:MAG: UDP-glucose dehydrogenase family protein [Candidatus Woesearchaeota archaeon]